MRQKPERVVDRRTWEAACVVYAHQWEQLTDWRTGAKERGAYRVRTPDGCDYPGRGGTPEEALARVADLVFAREGQFTVAP